MIKHHTCERTKEESQDTANQKHTSHPGKVSVNLEQTLLTQSKGKKYKDLTGVQKKAEKVGGG